MEDKVPQQGPAGKPRPDRHRKHHRRPPKPGGGGAKRESMTALDPFVQKVVDQAHEAHRALGSGLELALYAEQFRLRLTSAGCQVEAPAHRAVKHRDKRADEITADLLVDGKLPVLLKADAAWEFSAEDAARLTAWQKHWDARQGLLLNFGREQLVARCQNFTASPFPEIPLMELLKDAPIKETEQPQASILCRGLLRVARAHGLGYEAKTYRALLRAEFQAESFEFAEAPTAEIKIAGQSVGTAVFRDMLTVQRACVLLLIAQQDQIHARELALVQTALRHLGLGWGLVAHFGKRHFQWRWVSAPARQHPAPH